MDGCPCTPTVGATPPPRGRMDAARCSKEACFTLDSRGIGQGTTGQGGQEGQIGVLSACSLGRAWSTHRALVYGRFAAFDADHAPYCAVPSGPGSVPPHAPRANMADAREISRHCTAAPGAFRSDGGPGLASIARWCREVRAAYW